MNGVQQIIGELSRRCTIGVGGDDQPFLGVAADVQRLLELCGLGTGLVVDKFGWNGALAFWGVSALICALICLPMCFKKKCA